MTSQIFNSKINFEYEEVSMEKIAPLFKPCKTIFILNFPEYGKILFGSVKV
jgi:hypothetical protein